MARKALDLRYFGFSCLFENSKSSRLKRGEIISTDGEIIGNREAIYKQVAYFQNPQKLSVNLKPSSDKGQLYNATVYPAPINSKKPKGFQIGKKHNLDTQLYGYYTFPFTQSIALVKIFNHKTGSHFYNIVNIPVGVKLAKNSKTIKKLIQKEYEVNRKSLKNCTY